jgi:hypothetical protein
MIKKSITQTGEWSNASAPFEIRPARRRDGVRYGLTLDKSHKTTRRAACACRVVSKRDLSPGCLSRAMGDFVRAFRVERCAEGWQAVIGAGLREGKIVF